MQQWLANQIFESSNYLSLQFTEAVVERTWENIQKYKLEQLKSFINPVGRTDEAREQLREAGNKILRPLELMTDQMMRMRDLMSEQTVALNTLCKQNGFSSTLNKDAYQIFEVGQTYAVQSMTKLFQGELSHIGNIADLFVKSN